MAAIDPHTFHTKGPNLSSVLASSSIWERAVLPIGTAARSALAIVTGLLALATGCLYLAASELPASQKPSLFMFGWPWAENILLVTVPLWWAYSLLGSILLLLAAITEGFGVAGPRLQIGLAGFGALGALALAPLAVVTLILVANIVAFVVIAVAVVALGLFVLFAASDS